MIRIYHQNRKPVAMNGFSFHLYSDRNDKPHRTLSCGGEYYWHLPGIVFFNISDNHLGNTVPIQIDGLIATDIL